jgi:hypothetical protein
MATRFGRQSMARRHASHDALMITAGLWPVATDYDA